MTSLQESFTYTIHTWPRIFTLNYYLPGYLLYWYSPCYALLTRPVLVYYRLSRYNIILFHITLQESSTYTIHTWERILNYLIMYLVIIYIVTVLAKPFKHVLYSYIPGYVDTIQVYFSLLPNIYSSTPRCYQIFAVHINILD